MIARTYMDAWMRRERWKKMRDLLPGWVDGMDGLHRMTSFSDLHEYKHINVEYLYSFSSSFSPFFLLLLSPLLHLSLHLSPPPPHTHLHTHLHTRTVTVTSSWTTISKPAPPSQSPAKGRYTTRSTASPPWQSTPVPCSPPPPLSPPLCGPRRPRRPRR